LWHWQLQNGVPNPLTHGGISQSGAHLFHPQIMAYKNVTSLQTNLKSDNATFQTWVTDTPLALDVVDSSNFSIPASKCDQQALKQIVSDADECKRSLATTMNRSSTVKQSIVSDGDN